MKKACLCLLAVLGLTACTHTYYVVRHAEKVPATNMSTDDPLSDEGKRRAQLLKDMLKDKQIKNVFVTNTLRSRSTAEPLADTLGLRITIYGPIPDSGFMHQLKALRSNTLIVGHSNTVDDIVNSLTEGIKVPGDLPETAYDNLFIIRYRRFFGNHVFYQQQKY